MMGARRSFFVLAVIGSLALDGGDLRPPARAQVPSSPYRPPLRTLRYLGDKDGFLRHRSVVAPEPTRRTGGEISYYGNRLSQFQYFGRDGEGGYYDAWSDYLRRRKLDPNRYQYRAGHP